MFLDDTTLIMCSWNRLSYIPTVLASYESQEYKCQEFIIWNNQKKFPNELENFVVGKMGVRLYHHHGNIGGFGRFYAARDLATTKYVIFVDDDCEMKPNLIRHLYENKQDKAIVGLWGFVYPDKNGSSRLMVETGNCDYVGTCGQISTREVFCDTKLYECPEKYWFIEDIWLSFFAKYVHAYKLVSCGRLKNFSRNLTVDETGNITDYGLYDQVGHLKPEFIDYCYSFFGDKKTPSYCQ